MIHIKVNVRLLSESITRLDHEIDEYYDNYLNMYNEFNQSHSSARSDKLELLYDSVEEEKKNIQIFFSELEYLKKIYAYILNGYESIGKNIECDLKEQKTIFTKFEKIKQHIKKMEDLNNGIRVTNNPVVMDLIKTNKEILESINNGLLKIEEKTKEKLSKIEEIENNINKLISEFDVSIISEIDVNTFM